MNDNQTYRQTDRQTKRQTHRQSNDGYFDRERER